MIYALVSIAAAFAPPSMRSAPMDQQRAAVIMATPNAAPVYAGKYADELKATATAMVTPGKVAAARGSTSGDLRAPAAH